MALTPAISTSTMIGCAVLFSFSSVQQTQAAPLTADDVTHTVIDGGGSFDTLTVLQPVDGSENTSWGSLSNPSDAVLGVTAKDITGAWTSSRRSIGGIFADGYKFVSGNISAGGNGRGILLYGKGLTAVNNAFISIGNVELEANQEWYADANSKIFIGRHLDADGNIVDYSGADNMAGVKGNNKNLTLNGGGEFQFYNNAQRGLTISLGSLSIQGGSSAIFDARLQASTVSISGASSSATFNGNLTIGSFHNEGTITFGSNIVIDISGLTFTQDGDNYTTNLFTGSGTSNLGSLSSANLTGVVLSGKAWTLNNDGTISYYISAHDLVWNGTAENNVWNSNSVNWNNGTENVAFVSDDNVVFGEITGDRSGTVVIESNLSVGSITLNDAYTFNVTGDCVLTALSMTVGDGGSITKTGDARLTMSRELLGDTSVVINEGTFEATGVYGNGASTIANYTTGVNGTLAIGLTGNLTASGGSNGDYSSITLAEGFAGKLEITAGLLSLHDSDLKGTTGLVLNGGGLLMTDNIENGYGMDVAISEGATGVIRTYGRVTQGLFTGKISGGATSTLFKTDGGTLTLNNFADFAGILSIGGGKVVLDGDGHFAQLQVGSGVTFEVNAGKTIQIGTLNEQGVSTVYERFSSANVNYIIHEGANVTDSAYIRGTGGTITLSGGGSYSAHGLMLSADRGSATTLNVETGTTFHITGTTTTTNHANKPCFSLGHWNADNVININGTLISEAGMSAADGRGTININTGGILELRQGLHTQSRTGGNIGSINVHEGAILRLGTETEGSSGSITTNLLNGSILEGRDSLTVIRRALGITTVEGGTSSVTFRGQNEGSTIQLTSAQSWATSTSVNVTNNTTLLFTGGANGNNYARFNIDSGSTLAIDANGNFNPLMGTEGSVNLAKDAVLDFREGITNGHLYSIISGNGSVISSAANMEISGDNTFTGGTTITGGNLTLNHVNGLGTGTINVQGGTFNGSNLAFGNRVEISSGSLINIGNMTSKIDVNQRDAEGSSISTSTINLGGLNGSKLDSIHLGLDRVTGEAGKIENVVGDIVIKDATFGINEEMVNIQGGTNTPTSSSIVFGEGNNSLTVTDSLTLDFSDSLCQYLAENANEKGLTIQIANNGNITINPNLNVIVDSRFNFISDWFKVDTSGMTTTDGSINLVWNATQSHSLYVASGGRFDLNTTDQLGFDSYQRVIVDGTFNVNITDISANDVVKLPGLEGTTSTGLIDSSNSTAGLTIQLGKSDSASASDANYDFRGSIVGNAQIEKVDNHQLTIGGTVSTTGLTVTDGKLIIEGNLTVNNTSSLDGDAANASGNVNIAANTELKLGGAENTIAGALNIKGSLSLLRSSSTTTINSIDMEAGSNISLAKDSVLTIQTGGLALAGNISGNGIVDVLDGIVHKVGNGSFGDSTQLELKDDASLLFAGGLTVGAISGTGSLLAQNPNVNLFTDADTLNDSVLELKNGTAIFAGSYQGTGEIWKNGTGIQTLVASAGSENYDLRVTEGQINVGAGEFRNVVVNSGGALGISYDHTKPSERSVFNSFTMSNGTLDLNMNVNSISQIQGDGMAYVKDGINITDSTVIFNNTGSLNIGALGDSFSFTLFETASPDSIVWSNNKFISGLLGSVYDLHVSVDGNKVIVGAKEMAQDMFSPIASDNNSAAGAALIFEGRHVALQNQTSTLFSVSDTVSRMIQMGDHESARDVMAAAAGSALTSYGLAQNDQMKSHMVRMRNRALQIGACQDTVNDGMPYFRMWMEGIGGYNKMDQDGREGGYSLSSWGGAVGVDADFSDQWSGGLSFTSMFGNLTAESVDRGKGHLDSYYLSLFTRYQTRNWSQVVVVSGGLNKGKLSRDVNYGDNSYRAHSSTDGYGIAAMYELSCESIWLDEKNYHLQPFFNVSMAHTSMNGFDETGADLAGLRANDQDMTVVTASLGTRVSFETGRNLFGRTTSTHLRANIAQDMGDDRSDVNVGFLGNTGTMQRVQSAKVGSTAAQVGATMVVPSGENSSFIIEANADFRRDASSVNGSIGYRYSF